MTTTYTLQHNDHKTHYIFTCESSYINVMIVEHRAPVYSTTLCLSVDVGLELWHQLRQAGFEE